MAEKRLNEIRGIRKERVQKLAESGIPPYPSTLNESPVSISDARKKEGKTVNVAGRLMGWREHGNVIFGDLKDETAQIQVFFQKKNLGEKFKALKLFDIGDFVLVTGEVFQTEAGELTVNVEEYQLLTKSIRPLPSTWHGLKDVEDRYRQRYVDLILNPAVREVFEIKAKVMQLLRKTLDDDGFVEAVTPALQPLYGGATAKPFVTHHNALDTDLYLRISDELYLKRLIVGGFHKIYEICTDFRNEGMDRWHNPEFSMLEFYWAYADYEMLMEFTEVMLSKIVNALNGGYEIKYGDMTVNFEAPWKRVRYKDAFKEVGVDIDDLKNVNDLKEAVKNNEVKVDFTDIKDLPSALDQVYKVLIRPNMIDPVFLIDHPYSMRPLAKRHRNNPNYAETFQLITAGAELINAYSELNDPQDQKARWEEDMKRGKEGAEEYQMLDEDYIRALEYGMPPTAGWGMGIDRFVAILTNQHSIKDTILFPTLRPETKD